MNSRARIFPIPAKWKKFSKNRLTILSIKKKKNIAKTYRGPNEIKQTIFLNNFIEITFPRINFFISLELILRITLERAHYKIFLIRPQKTKKFRQHKSQIRLKKKNPSDNYIITIKPNTLHELND